MARPVAGPPGHADPASWLDEPGFDVGILAGGGRVRLVLTGELDRRGVEELDRLVQLVGRAALPCVLDCGRLTFVDSAGATALRRAVDSGSLLHGVRGAVARTLALLDDLDRRVATTADPPDVLLVPERDRHATCGE